MRKKLIVTIVTLFIIISFALTYIVKSNNKLVYMSYQDFYLNLENEKIENVVIKDNKIEFNIKNDSESYYTDNPNYEMFKEKLLLKGVTISESSSTKNFNLVFDVLFYGLFFGSIILGIYKFSSFNGEKFKIVKHTNVDFSNIAGMDDLKKEMIAIIDVLKNPKQYEKKGIRQTKGIIFEGAPGNGKTLFAKALASETDVNFIATKGADFQSAMMSVGSQKIKTLFKKAKFHKPCIIFIDEFDSIGERRNYAGTGVDKENNRIITTMLNEMDGFETSDGILVIAATNSYNSLDSALIRPGRFDLKYNISNPDFETRIKLIDLYTKEKLLSDDVDKTNLADAFENLSCSAIETIINEASVLAMINKREKIDYEDIITASMKVNCIINIKKLRKK